MLESNFKRGKFDLTLFIKRVGGHILLVHVYVDYLIFASIDNFLCEGFSSIMCGEFEISMIGELTFFLGLQIKQMEDGIFISQSKYYKEVLKKFGIDIAKDTSTLMATSYYLDKDE